MDDPPTDPNQWTIRTVVAFLGAWSILVVLIVGALSLIGKPVAEGWWTLAGVGPGALAALLSSTRTRT